jgi:hypothetical protein
MKVITLQFIMRKREWKIWPVRVESLKAKARNKDTTLFFTMDVV